MTRCPRYGDTTTNNQGVLFKIEHDPAYKMDWLKCALNGFKTFLDDPVDYDVDYDQNDEGLTNIIVNLHDGEDIICSIRAEVCFYEDNTTELKAIDFGFALLHEPWVKHLQESNIDVEVLASQLSDKFPVFELSSPVNITSYTKKLTTLVLALDKAYEQEAKDKEDEEKIQAMLARQAKKNEWYKYT